MTTTMNALPYEILSAILEITACSNASDSARYTYGLSQAPEPLQDVHMQRVVRGYVPTDTRKWNAVDSIRQVNRQWHDWAAEYALSDLYITRWRGSERWVQSRSLRALQGAPSGMAVYRDPYHSLRHILELFNNNPAVATCVRRIWFHGYYTAETVTMIFSILYFCAKVRYVTLPWTALRYGSADSWSRLLRHNSEGEGIASLELLAGDLKKAQFENVDSQIDLRPLESFKVNFSSLRRLKVKGQSNHLPVTDTDLIAISRTAKNLRELHITDTSTITPNGLSSLLESSQNTLEVLEHCPALTTSRDPPPSGKSLHDQQICSRILACPRLRDISVTLPSICPALFTNTNVKWAGEMQLRASTICGDLPRALKTSSVAREALFRTLDAARELMLLREQVGVDLAVEIAIREWIFEPKAVMVHGDFALGRVIADGLWPVCEEKSGKGGYGLSEGRKEGDWTAINEGEFVDGLRRGYVGL